ncbi:hypothetical protein [Candidatus Protofrankia californiensis]|uniref:hypothetical protein n=1 Tax=Candidatus Protofrankia californiensis TaxID=1839754 RepID=UPI0019D22B49|nr:hypothetical protein [Candidatus Protofrankia californiensis]
MVVGASADFAVGVYPGVDLARGSGQDESLDPAAAEISLAYAHANTERFAGLGIIAPPVPTTSDDPAVQPLSLLDRAV